jgi:hypothetical protein
MISESPGAKGPSDDFQIGDERFVCGAAALRVWRPQDRGRVNRCDDARDQKTGARWPRV